MAYYGPGLLASPDKPWLLEARWKSLDWYLLQIPTGSTIFLLEQDVKCLFGPGSF